MKSNRNLNFVIFFFLLFFTLPLFAYKEETFMVAMRDSVRLATVVYQPSHGEEPWPTILIRTPYGGEYRKSLVDGWLTSMGDERFIDFFVQHPDYEPIYDRVNLSTRYDSVNVPILHIAGSQSTGLIDGLKIRKLESKMSRYPRFEKNPNTGEPFRQNTATKIAHQTIYHDWAHPSALCLPVLKTTSLPSVTVEKDLTILGQNYPNPFNNETVIPLRFPDQTNFKAETHLTIFNVTGRCVKQWKISACPFERVTVKWQGRDERGHPLPSGLYIIRLTNGRIVEIRKIMLLR